MPDTRQLVRLNIGRPTIMDPIYALLDPQMTNIINEDINSIANRGGYEIPKLRTLIKDLLVYRGGEVVDPLNVILLEPIY